MITHPRALCASRTPHGSRLRTYTDTLARCGLFASMIASTPPCGAQTSATLPRVSITATRAQLRVDETLADTTIINREELVRESGRSLTSLLGQQGGVQISANGGPGQYASAFINGLEARHTLLLVDGMRVGSASIGVPSLSNLPVAALEQLDIVRGPLSALYGSDAVGGVIQAFTRRGQPGFWPSLTLGWGSQRQRQAHSSLAFGQGILDGAVFVGRSLTDGFSATSARALWGVYHPDADGFAQSTGSLNLGLQLSPNWRIEGSALSAQGRSQFDDGPGADARARLSNTVHTLRARGKLAPNWSTQLMWGQSTDRYDTQVSASPYAELGATETTQQQISWEHSLSTPWGSALALLERLDQHVTRPDTPYDITRRSIDAVGLSLAGNQGRHTWQGGVRQDHNSQFGTQNTGSIAYGLDLHPQWRLGTQLGSSFVAPSFNQLYYPGFGNPDLQPEEGRHSETSLRWMAHGHTLRAAWVDHRIRGYIPSGPHPSNVPHTQIDGLILSYDGRWHTLRVGASYEHLDPRNTTAGPNFGLTLPRRAKQVVRARAEHAWGRMRLGGALTAYGARFDDSANTLALPGYVTADLRADWRLDPNWTIGLQGFNLTNTPFETAWGYNQAGRLALLTLRWAPDCRAGC